MCVVFVSLRQRLHWYVVDALEVESNIGCELNICCDYDCQLIKKNFIRIKCHISLVYNGQFIPPKHPSLSLCPWLSLYMISRSHSPTFIATSIRLHLVTDVFKSDNGFSSKCPNVVVWFSVCRCVVFKIKHSKIERSLHVAIADWLTFQTVSYVQK